MELHLDGDARAWVWSPNLKGPDRLDMDLLPNLAAWASLGIGGDVPESSRDDSLFLMFEVDLGHNGTATLGGEPISSESVTTLVAARLDPRAATRSRRRRCWPRDRPAGYSRRWRSGRRRLVTRVLLVGDSHGNQGPASAPTKGG